MKGDLIKMAFSEKIVIAGMVYDCLEYGMNTFTLVCSIPESHEILAIYEGRRNVPCYHKGATSEIRIWDIKEQTLSDDKITMLIEIR